MLDAAAACAHLSHMANMLPLDGPALPPASGGAPRSLVIFLHGYGPNGDDLIFLANYWRDALADTAFIAPNAPEPAPGGFGGYQWWALNSLTPAARAAGVRHSADILNAFIDSQLAKHGLTEDRLALVGFSQGTMMALHVGPRRARALAGIIGYSGMLADPDALRTEALTKPPVLLVHGDADEVLPVAALTEAQHGLGDLGFDVTAHVSPGLGHSLDEDGLRLGYQFLARVLA